MSSSDEARPKGSEVPPPQKKQKTEKVRHRGKHCTIKGRMAKHPGEFFQQGDEMWCIACQVSVAHKESCYAKRHLESQAHAKNKRRQAQLVETPGPLASVQNPVEESASIVSVPSTPGTSELKTEWERYLQVCIFRMGCPTFNTDHMQVKNHEVLQVADLPTVH